MSKFKDEIAQKLFVHLDKTLSPESKAKLTPSLTSEIIYSVTDFVLIERFNSIFDQAIGLEKALIETQNKTQKEDELEESESFMKELKNL